MSTAKAMQLRVLRRPNPTPRSPRTEFGKGVLWADRLIAMAAVTAGLFVLGAYLEELLWAVMAALTIFALGAGD